MPCLNLEGRDELSGLPNKHTDTSGAGGGGLLTLQQIPAPPGTPARCAARLSFRCRRPAYDPTLKAATAMVVSHIMASLPPLAVTSMNAIVN
jgi:hypothetical protein